ncbi:ABC transporter ATP-binding protein [Acuticoccus mangrovi]|uniref:ATP-binding cassette domain-containing protein n=1 Tax=Acuticoccus mangrovi TaxID=2796142 RepID=A0A934IMC5_9HYPH|nr:oligopeptide/dipeptide ABC transporter ATP-binding protein [Acuticoccus mangrovi]MBJ3775013.1 ATP-binding cassette domain-containing protein [Acuticoccus mangrovi]
MSDPLVEVRDVTRRFGGGHTLFGNPRPQVHAVRGVSFDVMRGETLGIVGESGCGKSTIARMMVGLDVPTDGTLHVAGVGGGRLARTVQYVFQDSMAALNPRKRIGAILAVPLKRLAGLDRRQREERIGALLDAVSLDATFAERYPHELSGGQAQRVGIARALAAEPSLVVLDEPVSALDVSMQAQVINLLADLKRRFGLTYVFISHDLSVVEMVSDRVAVLYFGKVVEIGPAAAVFGRAQHPYTDLLLRSAPAPGRPLRVVDDASAELPDPYDPPEGCAFAPRCPRAANVCRSEDPRLVPRGGKADQLSACHFPLAAEL